MKHMETVRLTTSQACIRFLENQYVNYIDMDGNEVEHKFIRGIFMIPGHGNCVGYCNGIEQEIKDLEIYQGKNEQGMALAAVAFSRQLRRKQAFVATSSVGPGACNMITAAATATANNIPILLMPGDVYASRQPDPVLQQMEQPQNLTISAHDSFQAVVKYWGRVNRPEQIMTDMISAFRVMTDPGNCGAVAVSIPQDVQGESYDYPVDFFKKRVWTIERRPATKKAVAQAVEIIKNAKKPLLICGGGVRYAEAHKVFRAFAEKYGIAFGETQAGKSAIEWTHPLSLGGLGITGTECANKFAHTADVVIGVGTRYTDFTTASKWLYDTSAKFVNINPSEFQCLKMDATPVVADANEALTAIDAELEKTGYHTSPEYAAELAELQKAWWADVDRMDHTEYIDAESYVPEIQDANRKAVEHYIESIGSKLTQTAALGYINHNIAPDSIVVGAAGSLPGDLQALWRASVPNTYHCEYGYSCMGYEVAGAYGCKIACPDKEVYAMCGDGSFDMLHSELIASVQYGYKINVMLFDNASYGCINNLQVGQGNISRTTEKNMHIPGTPYDGCDLGPAMKIDYAGVAAAYGCKTYTVTTIEELAAALEDSKKQTVSTLIDMKVLPKSMSKEWEAWWRVGVASVSEKPEVQEAYQKLQDHLYEARHY
jgi:3D-(3,5/4)-trihydroxycyclohexane-1,2-dione acylhydrolase (decyclizing)